MDNKITFTTASQILKKSGIVSIGILNGIHLFLIKPNGRMIAIYDESFKTTIGGHLNALKHGCSIMIPLMGKESFIEAIIESLHPDEQELVDLLVLN